MQAPVSQLVRYPGPSATRRASVRPATPTRTPPALRRNPARTILSSQDKSSQVKSSQVHPFTTKESIQSQIREGQHLVHVHHSSRHTTCKQHLFTAEAFHLPARPVLREYSYRVLCSRHRCYATTISEYSTEFFRVVLIRSTIGTSSIGTRSDRPSSERQQSTFAPTHTRTSARPS